VIALTAHKVGVYIFLYLFFYKEINIPYIVIFPSKNFLVSCYYTVRSQNISKAGLNKAGTKSLFFIFKSTFFNTKIFVHPFYYFQPTLREVRENVKKKLSANVWSCFCLVFFIKYILFRAYGPKNYT
jgi:hypothetical protein